jgi:hypothetical protein
MAAREADPRYKIWQDMVEKYGFNPRVGAVPPGWYMLVDELIQRLLALGWDRDLHQIKEKFGGLRFYIGASTPEIDEAISDAEDKSLDTCEECGTVKQAAGLSTAPVGSWVRTLCAACRSK